MAGTEQRAERPSNHSPEVYPPGCPPRFVRLAVETQSVYRPRKVGSRRGSLSRRGLRSALHRFERSGSDSWVGQSGALQLSLCGRFSAFLARFSDD